MTADIPPIFPSSVQIEAQPDGTTLLRWGKFGYALGETAAMSRDGLEQVLDKLVAVTEHLSD